jgi:protein-S-isoprenylcysteine O-methyltransferase Ste14
MQTATLKAFRALLVLLIVMVALLFIAAGTLNYWQAWIFLVVYFAASTAVTLYLVRHDPALLERRMSGGPFAEKQASQKIIMSLTSLGFIALIVIPALDHRFSWSQLPSWLVAVGNAMVLAGFVAVYFVFRENSFTSATIELAPDQKVISTGPYAVVRHPMYAGGLILLFGMPIALGSGWGVLVAVAMLPALIWRLIDEERFLAKNLPGYDAYRGKVRYRLVPGMW